MNAMTNRERFLNHMHYRPVDCPPLHLVGPWPDTLERWYREGLPRGSDPNVFLGISSPLAINNVSGQTGLYPLCPERTIREDDRYRIFTNSYGVVVRDYKDQTTMPEWLEFPVQEGADLERVLMEHFDLDQMEERFSSAWEDAIVRPDPERLVLVDGGCYSGKICLDYQDTLFNKETQILTCRTYLPHELDAAVKVLANGQVRLNAVLSEEFPAAQAPDVFQRLREDRDRYLTAVFNWTREA